MLSAFSESANGISSPDKSYVEGETLLGQKELAQMVDKARRPYQQGPYQGLPDLRFTLLDEKSMEDHFDMYDMNDWVRIGSNIMLNAALGGSVTITDSFDQGLSEEQAKSLLEWRAFTNVNLCKAAHRYKTSVGFMPWLTIPNSMDIGEAKPLPLKGILSFYAENLIGDPMYAFFEKPGNSFDAPVFMGHIVGKAIRNVYVTTWYKPHSPTKFRTDINAIMPWKKFAEDKKNDASVADARLARPFLVTSWTDFKAQSDLTFNAVPNLATAKGSRKDHSDDERLSAALQVTLQARHQLGPQGAEEMIARVSSAVRSAKGTEEGPRVALDPGQFLESQTIPVAPKEVSETILLYVETVLTTLGVPPSTVLSESSRGKVASGSDQNAATLFRNSQMALKQDLVQLMTQTHNAIHAHSKIQMYLMHQPWDRHVTVEEVDRAVSTSVKISLPGTPPEDVMAQLYREGILKYSARREYLSRMHAIPLEDLNETPDLTLPELITDYKSSMLDTQLESEDKLQKSGFKEQEKMQMVDVQSKEKLAKAKPKAKPKSKAKKR